MIGKDVWIFFTEHSTSINTDSSVLLYIVENSYRHGKHAAAPCTVYTTTLQLIAFPAAVGHDKAWVVYVIVFAEFYSRAHCMM